MTELSPRDARTDRIISAALLRDTNVNVIGCGAVGRQVALQLGAMGVGQIHLQDFDKIGEENLGTQGWPRAKIGQYKVDALEMEILKNSPDCRVIKSYEPFTEDSPRSWVVFACVDSLDVRRTIFNVGYIGRMFDARVAQEMVVVHSFAKNSPTFEQHTGTDADTVVDDCTTRQTIYSAFIAASLLVQAYANWLRDPTEEEVHLAFTGSCFHLQNL